jgi:hypothetical protein
MGGNIYQDIKRLISVDPESYINLSESEKYQVARIIGKITRTVNEETPTMAIGPGRWGTTTVSLGIPVSFSEIANISVLCERDFQAGGMTPELSYGSHFFQDLVEENIFYCALFTQRDDVIFNAQIISKYKNLLTEFLPEEKRYQDIIKVIEPKNMKIISNIVSNKVICYIG